MVSSFSIVTLLLICLCGTLASPLNSCSTKSYNANFDDIKLVPGIPLQRPPVPYMGLYCQGLNVINIIQSGNLVPGVLPHSPNNFVLSDVFSQMSGTSMLTTNYQGSNPNVTFSLSSFYYGCVISGANGATAIPTQCNIQITGYRGKDNSVNSAIQVKSRQFQYNPTTMTGTQQQAFTGQIDGFTDINFLYRHCDSAGWIYSFQC